MQMAGDRKATNGWGNHTEPFFSWETRRKGSAFLTVLYGQRFSEVVPQQQHLQRLGTGWKCCLDSIPILMTQQLWARVQTVSVSVSPQALSGLPWWLRRKESACQCMRHGFHSWVGKTPWRRAWKPSPVFLPGESHGQRNLAGYSPQGRKESDMTEAT